MNSPVVAVRLDPETHNALNVAAARAGVPRSALLRRAIVALVIDLASEATDE